MKKVVAFYCRCKTKMSSHLPFVLQISGFTAWSSEREPSQVFKLLESIYQQMDRAAKKLGVFKVRYVGTTVRRTLA